MRIACWQYSKCPWLAFTDGKHSLKDLLPMNQIPMKYLGPQITACLTLILSISGFQLTSNAAEKDTCSMIETPKDVNSVPSDAEVTASGLASRELTAGTGSESPSAADTVTVHYSGWTTDGNLFDSCLLYTSPRQRDRG